MRTCLYDVDVTTSGSSFYGIEQSETVTGNLEYGIQILTDVQNLKIPCENIFTYSIRIEFYVKFNFLMDYVKIYKVFGKIKLILDILYRMCQDVNNLGYPWAEPLTELVVVMLQVSDGCH